MSTYNLPKFDGLNVGDETRRHGDYVGLPHGETDGTSVGSVSGPDRGVPVVYDGGNDELVAYDADASSGLSSGQGPIAGVLYAFDVYGDSSNAGPYIDGDSDATVKTSGTVLADLGQGAGGVADGDEGTALGPNGELLILEVVDASNNIAEVLLR